MSHLTQKQLVAMLIETERTADKILQGKQQIVSLDKCRQATREAIRNLEKSKQDKSWITLGSNLVKLETTKALELLKKDQQVLNVEINKIRSEQKVLVNQLRDLEFQSPLRGFDLKPLDRNEMAAFQSNIPRF